MKRGILIPALILLLCGARAQVSLSSIDEQVIGLGGEFETIDLLEHTDPASGVLWEVYFKEPATTGDAPSWSKDVTYQFNMNVTAVVSSKGEIAEGDNHLLAVVDAQDNIRGVTSAIQVGDNWVYFLTVSSNTNGEELLFKFYDGRYDQILSNSEPIVFVSNQILGAPDDPVIVDVAIVNFELEGSLLSFEVVDGNFVGSEEMEVRARLIDNPESTDVTTITLTLIDDYEPYLSEIPDQTISFNGSFLTFNLNDHLVSDDNDPVVFSATGATDLTVNIDVGGQVTITQANDWSGTETITFAVTEQTSNGFEFSRSADFKVRMADQAPVIDDIPDQIIGVAGDFLDINLSEYVTANNPESVVWDFEIVTPDSVVSDPAWSVDASDFQYDMNITARVHSLGKWAEGNQHSLAAFRPSDQELLGVTQAIQVADDWFYFLTVSSNATVGELIFRFYDAEGSRIIPVKETLGFSANAIIGDPLEPVVLNAGYLSVSIDNDVASFSFVTDDWVGKEVVRFTATDTETEAQLSASEDVSLEVSDQVVSPSLANIPDQTINEGEAFATIDLSQYLSGMPIEDVDWVLQGADDLSPVESAGQITFSIPENYYGIESLNVQVFNSNDPSFWDQDELTLTVVNVNDQPEFTSNPLTEIEIGQLYNYVIEAEDIDSENLIISSGALPAWLNFFTSGQQAILYGTPAESDVAGHSIELTVSDGDLESKQLFQITVLDPVPLAVGSERAVIFPNPVEDLAVLMTRENGALEVYNLLGTLVRSYQVLAGANELDFSDLESGIYIVRLLQGDRASALRIKVR